MRSPLWVEPAYLCTYSIVTKALPWPVLGFKLLRDGGHPFRVECPCLCMYSIGTKLLVCSGFQVPSRTVHPVGSCIRISYLRDRFVGTFCCCLLCPGLACHMALDSGLSHSGASSAATL